MWNFRRDVLEQLSVRHGKQPTSGASLGLGDSCMRIKSYRQSANSGELCRRLGMNPNIETLATKNQNDKS